MAQPVGVDPTNGRYGAVAVETCLLCGTLWLVYRVEFEAFSNSGRWYRGLIDASVLATLTPTNALAHLESLSWYFAGGSYYNSPGMRLSGPIYL